MLVDAVVTWPAVIVAIVTGLPAIIGAVAALRNGGQLKTGNEKTVGEMVTEVHGEASAQATPYQTHGG